MSSNKTASLVSIAKKAVVFPSAEKNRCIAVIHSMLTRLYVSQHDIYRILTIIDNNVCRNNCDSAFSGDSMVCQHGFTARNCKLCYYDNLIERRTPPINDRKDRTD